MSETDCGAMFAHDPHGYLTHSGMVKACDGSTTKRATPPAPESATDPSACVEGEA